MGAHVLFPPREGGSPVINVFCPLAILAHRKQEESQCDP